MSEVLAQDGLEVPAPEDKEAIETLPAQGAHDSLTDGVRLGRLDEGPDYLDGIGGEHGVEAS